MTGLRAELAVEGADACPVAAVSAEADGPIREVQWADQPDGGAVERFALDDVSEVVETDATGTTDTRASDTDATGTTDGTDAGATDTDATGTTGGTDGPTSGSDGAGVTFEPVFTDGDRGVAEFDREWDGCVCELIEATGCPVESVEARDGALLVTVHTRSRDRLKTVIAAAREAASDVSLNYVVTGDARDATDPVVVDRGRLTARQREVVATAYELGYFEHPREANAERVADELGVAPATFREHLAAAQRKLLGAVVEASPADE